MEGKYARGGVLRYCGLETTREGAGLECPVMGGRADAEWYAGSWKQAVPDAMAGQSPVLHRTPAHLSFEPGRLPIHFRPLRVSASRRYLAASSGPLPFASRSFSISAAVLRSNSAICATAGSSGPSLHAWRYVAAAIRAKA